jgi:predicted transcriptional regulator
MDASNEEYYELNEAQKASIEISRAQIKNGEFRTNEEVMRELWKLLNNYR